MAAGHGHGPVRQHRARLHRHRHFSSSDVGGTAGDHRTSADAGVTFTDLDHGRRTRRSPPPTARPPTALPLHGSPARRRPRTRVSGLAASATAGVGDQRHRHRPGRLQQRGHRLHRHGPLHQQRRPGRLAGQLHVHRWRRGRAYLPAPRSRRPATRRSPPPTRSTARSPARPASPSRSARRRPTHFIVDGQPSDATAGTAFSFTVTAGTPSTTWPPATPARSTSPAATARRSCRPTTRSRPATAAATFTDASTLKTAGSQTVTATDTVIDHRHQPDRHRRSAGGRRQHFAVSGPADHRHRRASPSASP